SFAAAFYLGGQLLHDRAKEVAKPAPFLAVEIVEQFGHVRAFEPSVADQLAHMSPVLLFDPRVVVLAIGAGASHGDWPPPFARVVHQMPVEKLAAVIGIE